MAVRSPSTKRASVSRVAGGAEAAVDTAEGAVAAVDMAEGAAVVVAEAAVAAGIAIEVDGKNDSGTGGAIAGKAGKNSSRACCTVTDRTGNGGIMPVRGALFSQ
jgi:hypothetical protein